MNSVIENLEQIAAAATSVAETKFELLKLKTADKISASISGLAIIVVTALIGVIAVLILSFGLAYFIGNKLGDVSYGFFIMGGIFVLAGLLVYANRQAWIHRPITNILIDKFTN